MKKIVSIFLVVSLLASFAATAFAADSSDVSICHSLTCDGKKIYVAQPGEEIKVILTFESSNGKPFDIKNIQSEVAYDTEFFELADDEDIKVLASPEKSEWQMQESKHYEYRVFAVFAMFPNTQEGLLHCESSQVMAEYTLKVKDTAQTGDSGFVKSLVGEDVNVFGPDFEQYGESASDLTVVIGTPVTTYKLTYMNGTEQFAVSEVAGETNIINGPSPSEGLVFLGWEDSNGKLWKPGDSYSPSMDMIFTAKWGTPVQYFTLTFDTNGGNTIGPLRDVQGGTVIELSSYVPTRSGYSFEGWFSDAELTQPITSIKLLANTTIYAKWSKISTGGGGGGAVAAKKYTLTFETNGGKTVNKITKAMNTIVDLSECTTEKDGYIFDGWYADKDFNNVVTSVKLTKNTTVYAKWTKEAETDKPGTEDKDLFVDVKTGDWFYENVKYVVKNKLMNGVSEDQFAPNDTLTRAMLVTILYRLESEPETDNVSFTDVKPEEYYANAVSWAKQKGIVNGITETEFAPNSNITREQIATIIHRYADFKGYDVSVSENTNIFSYDDAESISKYAVASMEYAVGSGLIQGKSATTLNPKDNATRAEIAAILQRFIEANKQ